MPVTSMPKSPSKSPKTYASVNAMIRGTCSTKFANRMIDSMTEIMVHQNVELMTELTNLIMACSTPSSSLTNCPDAKVLARARKVALKYGAAFPRA